MSGTNYEITCPNCQLDCSVSEDHKPFLVFPLNVMSVALSFLPATNT